MTVALNLKSKIMRKDHNNYEDWQDQIFQKIDELAQLQRQRQKKSRQKAVRQKGSSSRPRGIAPSPCT